jgi:hypothetical protein
MSAPPIPEYCVEQMAIAYAGDASWLAMTPEARVSMQVCMAHAYNKMKEIAMAWDPEAEDPAPHDATPTEPIVPEKDLTHA